MIEKNISTPKIGMSFSDPSTLKEGQFSILLNGSITNADSFLILSNEQSNLLYTRFKEGYKVIGTNIVPSLSTTFIFLTNPLTGDSEIGYIFDVSSPDKPDLFSQNTIIEQAPLETTTQFPLTTYYTFISNKCLDFDINHPITSYVKIDDCNVRIYFNDFKNVPRYIDYKNFKELSRQTCETILEEIFDCDRIKIFPETCYPRIEVVDIVPGGQNIAGVYQFAICYSDVNANKITDYFYVTNPIPLYDQPITVDTAYPVYKSFKLRIDNINTDFRYFNIVVLKTINNVTTPQLIETFDINSNNFEYVYTGVDKNIQLDLSIDEILQKNPYYNKAKITEVSGGQLMLANLEEDRVLNLQPVVSEIPVYWQTVEMDEESYANPIIAQNNVGYLGDETYPFGISFTYKNTKQSNVFVFVNREATPYDLEDVSFIANSPCPQGTFPSGSPIPKLIPNPDVITLSSCDPTTNRKRYEVYNTASGIADVICIDSIEPEDQTIEIIDEIDCLSDVVLYSDIVDPTTPSFYLNLPNTIQYPPQNKEDAEEITDWINNPVKILSNIVNDENTQASINLCNCNSFLPLFPQGATLIPNPIIIDLTNSNTSVEIIQEPFTYNVNTYSPIFNPETKIPKPTSYPKSEPDPCKNYSDNEKDKDIGFQAWIDQKPNNNSAGAILLTQSRTEQCAIEQSGAFIGGNESWYNFYLSNPDGVATITLSTDRTNCPTNPATNNSNFELYSVDSIGNVSPVAEIPLQSYIGNNGVYKSYQGLIVGATYFIKVIGNYPNPSGLVRECCKNRTFRICVTSPNPTSVQTYNIPGSAKITKTCKIKYQGVPQNSCKPKPDKYGYFAYVESQETYPCNEEVWEDLAGKPIRHFKFPDHTIVPLFKEIGTIPNLLSRKKNKIYPKGIRIEIQDIKNALNRALDKGLITKKELKDICGYRIYRGNRRGNQSIIAKGLFYDVWSYKDNIYNTGNSVLFPNFPFNDRNKNPFVASKKIKNALTAAQAINGDIQIEHPFFNDGFKNNKFTFHSPNTSFNNPGLGTEVKFEFEQIGTSIGFYNELKNNSKYQYIGAGIISAAIGFSAVEVAFEALNTMVNATLTLDLTIFGSGTSIPLGLILAAIGENIIAPQRIYSHYGEWYELIKGFAPYRNFGLTYVATGTYIKHDENCIGNYRRTIANAQYLKPGVLNVNTTSGSIRFNNFKRESSVFIELNKNSFFKPTKTPDNSRVLPDCNVTNGRTSTISSFYGSIKNPLLSQYGQIDNIEWIDTGYNGIIDLCNEQDTSCDTIFGGDTYINRFEFKRKTPMFLDDRVIPSTSTQVNTLNVDIQMSLLPNIGYPIYYMNYPTSLDYTGLTQALFGDVAVLSKTRADYNLLCFKAEGTSWADAGLGAAIAGGISGAAFGIISLPIAVGVISGTTKRDLGNTVFINGKYIHAVYGIPSFLCESDYNLDLQHGENIKEKNFPKNVGDINEWTQEYYIPISEDNYFSYNNDYSKQNKENPNFVLNNDFKQAVSDCKVSHPNTLIYSLKDDDQNSNYDGNLTFLANNFYVFPKNAGKVLIVKALSNGKVLVVQEDGYSVFNSFISQETNIGISTVGANSLFNRSIPAQSIKTDLGFGGSQTPAIIATEFGAYWVDNKRAQIVTFGDQAGTIIKPEEDWWFKENLPFHILEDFPDFDITNNFKYIGMIITYDQRYKRVLFTKRDVELKPEYKGHISYDGTFFHFGDEFFTVEDSRFFCDKSWTISYSPLLKSFVSFHSYKPNYYIPNQNYFSSGINYSLSNDQSEYGLWGHNLTNQSYQVFYGKKYPFMFEYSVPTKAFNKTLNSVEYFAEFYRFQDNLSKALIPNKTYSKALIYNQKQSSGLLELIVKEKNNRQQSYQYASGKQNQESRTILTEKINNVWSFNQFYSVAVYNNGQPLTSFQCDNISYKEINLNSISYQPRFIKEKLVGDYFSIRLINDIETNYQIQHRITLTSTIKL
jgi:hypothetical protein